MSRLRQTEYFSVPVSAAISVSDCISKVVSLKDKFLKEKDGAIEEIVDESLVFSEIYNQGSYAILTLSYFEKDK